MKSLISESTPVDYKIGIIDDKIEVLSRLIVDSFNELSKKSCVHVEDKYLRFRKACDYKKYFKKSKRKIWFMSDSDDLLRSEDVVIYGWHGVASLLILDGKDIRFFSQPKHPIVGFDAVCLVNKKYSPQRLQYLVKFIKELTNRSNTEFGKK